MRKKQKIEWAINELKNCQNNPDKESAHGHADYVLCELLSKIGCQAVVDEYEKVDGWYA